MGLLQVCRRQLQRDLPAMLTPPPSNPALVQEATNWYLNMATTAWKSHINAELSE